MKFKANKKQLQKKLIARLVSFIARAAIIMLIPIVGIAVYAGSVFLAGIPVGVDSFKEDSDLKSAQIIFWATAFSLIVFWIAWFKLKYYKSELGSFTRNYLKICMITGVILSVISMVALHVAGINSSKTEASGCDLKDAVKKAQIATYPIATNLGNGTAFAVSEKGDLITASHVIDGVSEVYVNWSSGKVPVKIIKNSPEYDIALLRFPKSTPDFIPLTSIYETTDHVYAVGWPRNALFAGYASVSSGVISRTLGAEEIRDNNNGKSPAHLQIVQTDAAINPGNSGGPLVGACGAVGMISAKSDSQELQHYGIVSEEGISFAVSSKTVKKVLGIR